MRTIFALIVALAVLMPGGGAKAVTTAGDMMHDCVKLETFWQRYPPTRERAIIPQDADAATCYGFILAVWHLAQIFTPDCSKGIGAPNCRPALGICLPQNSSLPQVLAVFLDYARSHSAEWHNPAGGQFYAAMLNAFGCKEFMEELRRSN